MAIKSDPSHAGTNMCHVTDAGNGYIVAKSLRKSTRGLSRVRYADIMKPTGLRYVAAHRKPLVHMEEHPSESM